MNDKIKNLEEKIEFWIDRLQYESKPVEVKILNMYCSQYKKLTGNYYVSRKVQKLREAGL